MSTLGNVVGSAKQSKLKSNFDQIHKQLKVSLLKKSPFAMLRPYRSSEDDTLRAASTFKINWRSRVVFVFGLPLLLVAALMGMSAELRSFDPRYHGVRKLVLQCIHSIYAESTKAALDMPKPPTVTASLEVPSTYAICQVCSFLCSSCCSGTTPVNNL
jgi:hypothetical protein